MARRPTEIESEVLAAIDNHPSDFPTRKQIGLKIEADQYAVNVAINALRKRRMIAKVPHGGFHRIKK